MLAILDNAGENQPLLPRLLVVDDEESICFSMRDYFSDQGYRVDIAQEIEDAEELVESTDYQVIIQDLRVSTRNQDGFNIVKLARQRQPETRIIVLTAYWSAELEDEARRCGADAFLRKPKPLSQLALVIRGLIESPAR